MTIQDNINRWVFFLLVSVFILPLLSIEAFSQNSQSVSELVKVVQEEAATEKILNEGYYISGRRARLVSHPDNKRWFMVLEKNGKDNSAGLAANNSSDSSGSINPSTVGDNKVQVLEVLPSRWLETMLRVVNNTSDFNTVFNVWGNVTVFQKRNFLFLTMVATESLFGDVASATKETKNYSPFEQQPQTQSVVKPGPEKTGVVPQEIRDKLMSVPRVEVLSFPFKMRETDENTVTVDPSRTETVFYNDMIITDRTGRLFPNQSEGRVYFMFETGDGLVGGAQIVLQPCQLLEKMIEKATSTSGQNLKFRISGRVDEFKGEFFLMPTMYLQEGYRGL